MEVSEAQSSPGRRLLLHNALIAFAAVLVYLPSLRGAFVFDDWILLVQHPLIHATDGLRRIWFSAEAPDYYPVSWTMWWLQWHLWGANTLGYHVVNVLLHAVNAVLVAQVLRRLDVRGAWLAGLVFAVHPVNAAAVAWISEQKTMLCMLFFLGTVLTYLRFANPGQPLRQGTQPTGQWQWYVASVLCFAVSLLSKPAAVMWPVILIGMTWWKNQRVTRRDWIHCLPYTLMSLAIAPVTVWFQAVRVLGGEPARTDGFLARLAGAGWAVWFYLWKDLAPVNLCVIYPRWQIHPTDLWVYVPGLLLVVALAFCWSKRATWGRQVLTGMGYFILMLFPVLGFFDQGYYRYSLVADHWQYLPIVAVIAMGVGGVGSLVSRVRGPESRVVEAIVAIAIVCLAGLTWRQAGVYHDEVTLWRDTVAKNPSAWLAQCNLGIALAHREQFDEAIVAFENALRYKPDDADTLNNLGATLAQQGRMAEAVTRWEQAVHYRPTDVATHNSLGIAYYQRGNLDLARREFSLVVLLDPANPEAHANLGAVLLSQGKTARAAEQFQAALRINPNLMPVRLSLGVALARLGEVEGATAALTAVLQVEPSNRVARATLEQLGRGK
jgi:Flp pilus assembly protein TadD